MRRESRPWIIGWTAAFVLVHVALDRFLDLAPGNMSGLAGMRLLEIFVLWYPVLLLACFLGFCLPRQIRTGVRWGLLVAYVALVLITAFAGGPEVRAWFDLLVRLSPLAALVFVFGNGRGWSTSRAIGLAFLLFGTWRSLYFNFPDLLVIAAGGGTPGPTPTIEWYRSFFLKVLWDLVYPILGLLFFFHRVPGIHRRPAWGDEFARLMRPLGNWIRRSLPIDVGLGSFFLVLDVAGSLLLYFLLLQAPTSGVGDDSRVFDLITLDQIFLLSIIAGVSEELVFRGVLQSGMERMLRRVRLRLFDALHASWGLLASLLVVVAAVAFTGTSIPDAATGDVIVALLVVLPFFAFAVWKPAPTIAILVQSVAFALVHAGYTDLNHIIIPWFFGLFMGLVYKFFGLLPAILVHIQIDIFAFGAEYAVSNPEQAPGIDLFLTFLFLVNVVLGLWTLIYLIITWWEGRRKVLPVLARS